MHYERCEGACQPPYTCWQAHRACMHLRGSPTSCVSWAIADVLQTYSMLASHQQCYAVRLICSTLGPACQLS
jgi:hypothetical protein